jgi:hypothetical protein
VFNPVNARLEQFGLQVAIVFVKSWVIVAPAEIPANSTGTAKRRVKSERGQLVNMLEASHPYPSRTMGN